MQPTSNRIIDVINWGRELFLERNVPHARYTIEVLLGHVLAKKRAELYCAYDYQLSAGELQRLCGYIEKRLNHWPLWHLVGSVEFFGLELSVSDRVLIPRPETEVLVEIALRELGAAAGTGVRYIADIGTGSGNIAIALAKSRSDVFIYATDISAAALRVAEANARRHGVDGAVSFVAGDLLAPFERCGRRCLDMVVSNPPYVAAEEWESLPREVRDREPREALFGGKDGLGSIRRIVAEAPRCLKPGGHLVCEFGKGQASFVRDLVAEAGAYARAEVSKDYTGIERVMHAVCV
jgi:release factor glutamine methyltransferase